MTVFNSFCTHDGGGGGGGGGDDDDRVAGDVESESSYSRAYS
eukprot:COSAG06_NODE_16678_length_987_cov_1.325450_1_plen_41_part_10